MINLNEQHNDEGFKKWQRKQRNGRIVFGLMVITAGIVYMLYQMDYKMPQWLFTWPIIIVGISILAAVKHGLNDWRWIVFLLIGTLFLCGYIYPDSSILQYKIPIILFLVGAMLIFKPRNHKHEMHEFQRKTGRYCVGSGVSSAKATQEDYLYVNNIFSGAEKVIISKDFKGGNIKNTFGGCEINLMQADIEEEAELRINQQFSGVKLIVPPHWVIKSDINCVFAGIEDKRPVVDMNSQGAVKTLILRGSIFMAGIEITSY